MNDDARDLWFRLGWLVRPKVDDATGEPGAATGPAALRRLNVVRVSPEDLAESA